MRDFADMVDEELDRARADHPRLHSFHEGYAVLLEEVEEFWGEVRKRSRDREESAMLAELVQVAAMARRIAEDMGLVDRPGRVA